MTPTTDISALQQLSRELRIDIIKMLEQAGSGHPGGSLSAIDILVCLYFAIMKHRPAEPEWSGRDRFVLSKGHAVPAVYAVLAKCGYFEKDRLSTLRKINSPLQGHPDRMKLPGIEASTGSLGQGLSIALGMALACKLNQQPNRVYCMLGDGESQAGQVWEALMAAPHLGATNLVVILDYNLGQIDGPTNEIMNLEPLASKLAAFNWDVTEIDGHDHTEILRVLQQNNLHEDKPRFVLAHTVKGKGVSFMEHQIAWHGKAPNAEETEKAVAEIESMEF